ncbi:MAG: hypothetical protein PW788_07925 [Micavibrio sp.]|nr:hypothetical protein [Micavibrio sp.]
MKKHIGDERTQISELVSATVVETFTNMFGQSVTADALARKMQQSPESKSVYSSVKLHHGKTHVEFCFRFDFDLLLQAAALIFSADYLANNPVHEDLACEIANIVCSKVKAYLNDRGYDTEMGFPYIPKPNENPLLQQQDTVHMHFYYDSAKAQRGVGVVVNFFEDGVVI